MVHDRTALRERVFLELLEKSPEAPWPRGFQFFWTILVRV